MRGKSLQTRVRDVVTLPTDAEVMAGVQRDEDWAKNELIRRYSGRMRQKIGSILRHDQDIEEALHDAWYRILKGAIGFKFRSKVGTWIYQVTKNAALRHRMCNDLRHRRPMVSIELLRRHPALVERRLPSPAQACIDRQEREILYSALGKLPPNHQQVLRSHLNGFQPKALAAQSQIHHQAYKSRLNRARAGLKRQVILILKSKQQRKSRVD